MIEINEFSNGDIEIVKTPFSNALYLKKEEIFILSQKLEEILKE